MPITKEQAFKIIESFLNGKEMRIGDGVLDKMPVVSIYNPPNNCYWMSVEPIPPEGFTFVQPSYLIGIDKESGVVKFFGTGSDEG
jgi:hypothetical protein